MIVDFCSYSSCFAYSFGNLNVIHCQLSIEHIACRLKLVLLYLQHVYL